MTMLDRFFRDMTDNQIRRNTIRSVPELIRAIEIHMDCQGIRHSAESHSRTPLAREGAVRDPVFSAACQSSLVRMLWRRWPKQLHSL
jgi:hypothetical protein